MTTPKWAFPCLVVAILAAIGLARLGFSRSSDAEVVISLAPNARPPRELPNAETWPARLSGAPATARGELPVRSVAQDPQLGALNWTSPDKGAIVFYWHTIKTGGTTVRTAFQRQAQLGGFSFFYLTRPPDSIMFRGLVHSLLADVRPRRLLIEQHNPWGLHPDALAAVRRVRAAYRAIGVPLILFTTVRKPVPLLLSLYSWRVYDYTPLCQWLPVADVQTRSLRGRTVVGASPDARSLAPRALGPADADAIFAQFDLVGVVERFDESMAALALLAGVRALEYGRANEAGHGPEWRAASAAVARAIDAARRRQPDDDGGRGGGAREVERAVERFSNLSLARVLQLAGRPGRKAANCQWWGCRAELTAAAGRAHAAICARVPVGEVVRTLSESQSTDEHLYARALVTLDAVLRRLGGAGTAELARLRAANAAFRRRGLRPPPAARAAAAPQCVGCGHEPHSQLDGCWPEWPFFKPEERCFACTRTWAYGGYAPNPANKRPPDAMPCYQDCWARLPAARAADESAPTADAADGAARCARALGGEDARRLLAREGRFCSPPCPPRPTPYDAEYMPS